MEPGVSVKQAALPDAVPAVRAAISTFLGHLDVPSARASDIQLAVTEACSNVIRHAYPGTEGELRCDARASASEIVISIYDWGAGSAAPSTTPGLGLGLPIMQRLCDRVSLSRIEGATRLELRFGRQA